MGFTPVAAGGGVRADELSTDHHLTTLLVGSFLRDSLAEFYVSTIFCLYGNQPEFLCELHKILHYIIAFSRMSQFSDPKGRRFESCQPHHADALLESRAFFFCPVFGKAAPGAPSGMRTARPAGQRPGRFQQSCGLLESARVPVEPGWRNGSSAPSPSGRDHASRERSHSPRGEVAKYAPQERFLHAPAGAPKKALRKRKAFPFLWLVWLYTA